MTLMVKIQDWDYMLGKNGDSEFYLWHHVTRADGGYGTEVREYFVIGSIKKDTVKNLYDHISSLHMSPSPQCYNEKKELRDLTKALQQLDII